MRSYVVTEGTAGILELDGPDGREEYYAPASVFREAQSLLAEFQNLKTPEGVKLKDSYHWEGFSWYPTAIVKLYFRIFFRYAKYQPLVGDFLAGEKEFSGPPQSAFLQLLDVFRKPEFHPTGKQRLLAAVVFLNNALVARRARRRLLFCRLGLEDFRSAEMSTTLKQLGLSPLEVMPCLRIKTAWDSLVSGGKYYFYGAVFGKPLTTRQVALDHLSPEKRRLFETAIRFLESNLGNLQKEYRQHLRRLKPWKSKLLYAFDDTNDYFFPLLYACRQNGFHTVGHQHAVYITGQVQSALQGIPAQDYPWFDKLIVWGPYWKRNLLGESDLHASRDIVIGANKVAWDYCQPPAPARTPRTILLPAEFLGDTAKVGQFVEKFAACGFHVLFKPKPQRESIEDQLKAYRLSPDTRAGLEIVTKLDAETIRRIDIIAGTMSTLIYELLPYNKIIWFLDMSWGEFFLYDLVKEGLAHHIRLPDVAPPDEMNPSLLTPTRVAPEEFFCPETLEETLRKHVKEPLEKCLS